MSVYTRTGRGCSHGLGMDFSPNQTMRDFLEATYKMLAHPRPEWACPSQVMNVFDLFRRDRATHDALAREWTDVFATH